jgi:haloalkane dehalogenase
LRARLLTSLVIVAVAGLSFAGCITRDGARVVPEGEGTVRLDAGDFEAFPLPDYAANYVTDDYKSYFVEVEPGIKVHVLEVGSGFPLFLQHGNPTSGFLYRKVAAALPTDRVRAIMPTLVGLGFSSKVPASEHTLENHVRWINGVLAQLELTEVIYAGQDWGGPIGMGALARSPDLLRGAVLLNTGFNAPTENMDLSSAHALVKTPVVGELAVEVFLSIFDRLPQMQGDPDSLPPDVVELYARPVEESGNDDAHGDRRTGSSQHAGDEGDRSVRTESRRPGRDHLGNERPDPGPRAPPHEAELSRGAGSGDGGWPLPAGGSACRDRGGVAAGRGGRRPMRVLKWVGALFGVYVAFVVLFETFFLGLAQPELGGTGIPMLVITTTDDSGVSRDRRVARFETDGKVYVSAHHWTRGWHRRALDNPNVRVEIDGVEADYVAVSVDGNEFDRVAAEFPIPLRFRFLMGFPPPRDILRLDPATPGRRTKG